MDFENIRKIRTSYTNKSSTTPFCSKCNMQMTLHQKVTGGIYWICGKCHNTIEKTAI